MLGVPSRLRIQLHAQKKGKQEFYSVFLDKVLLVLLRLGGWLRSDEHELLANLTNTQLRSHQI